LSAYAESLGYTDVKVKNNKVVYTDADGEKQEIDRELFENQYAAAQATEDMAKVL
jgi:hypothetical protein